MQSNKERAVSRKNRNLWLMAFDLVREKAIFNSVTYKHWLPMYRCWKSTMHKVTSLSVVSPSQRAAFALGPLVVPCAHQNNKKICLFLRSAEVAMITKCNLSASPLLKKKNPGKFHLKHMFEGRVEKFTFAQTLPLPQGLLCSVWKYFSPVRSLPPGFSVLLWPGLQKILVGMQKCLFLICVF